MSNLKVPRGRRAASIAREGRLRLRRAAPVTRRARVLVIPLRRPRAAAPAMREMLSTDGGALWAGAPATRWRSSPTAAFSRRDPRFSASAMSGPRGGRLAAQSASLRDGDIIAIDARERARSRSSSATRELAERRQSPGEAAAGTTTSRARSTNIAQTVGDAEKGRGDASGRQGGDACLRGYLRLETPRPSSCNPPLPHRAGRGEEERLERGRDPPHPPRRLTASGLIPPPSALLKSSGVAAEFAVAITPDMAELNQSLRSCRPDRGRSSCRPRPSSRSPRNEQADPIGDELHSPIEGIVHRYPDRVLLKADPCLPGLLPLLLPPRGSSGPGSKGAERPRHWRRRSTTSGAAAGDLGGRRHRR